MRPRVKLKRRANSTSPSPARRVRSNDERAIPDALSAWQREMHKRPLLTREQEVELAKRIERGDEEARKTMIESNLRLVISIARRYRGYGVPLSDLIQEGNIGLIQAVDRFDWRRGTRFSTTATLRINQAILRALDNHIHLIKLPLRLAEEMQKVARVQESLTQELEREPTAEELARRLQMPHSQVEECLFYLDDSATSLDEVVEETECITLTLGDSLLDKAADDPEQSVGQKELREELECALDELPPTYRTVIKLRYGFEDGISYTYDEIGRRLGLSRQRVMQINHSALSSLRANPRLKLWMN